MHKAGMVAVERAVSEAKMDRFKRHADKWLAKKGNGKEGVEEEVERAKANLAKEEEKLAELMQAIDAEVTGEAILLWFLHAM